MPSPVTLADVRAHVEHRIQDAEAVKTNATNTIGWYEAVAVERELRRVLAMLNQAQPCSRCGGSQYIRENCRDVWPCPACNPCCPEYKPPKQSKAPEPKTRKRLRDAAIDAAEQVCQANTERQTINGKRVSFEDQKRINGAFQDAMAQQYAALLNLKNHKRRQKSAKRLELDLYAQDAMERPGPLTDEQKARNLELLKQYNKANAIPDGAPCTDVLRALYGCAMLWEPGARIIGNLRADDIARACTEAIVQIEAWDSLAPRGKE